MARVRAESRVRVGFKVSVGFRVSVGFSVRVMLWLGCCTNLGTLVKDVQFIRTLRLRNVNYWKLV